MPLTTDDLPLVHPQAYSLRSTIIQLMNRAEVAADTAQTTAIADLFTQVSTALGASQTLEPSAMLQDATGHYGRHLKWELSKTLYRALSDADIATDLATLLSAGGPSWVSTKDFQMTINSLPGSTYGTTTGVTDITPDNTTNLFQDGGSIITLTVNGSGQVYLSGDMDETNFSEIYVSFDGYGSNPVRLLRTNGDYYIPDETGLYTLLQSAYPGTIGFTIDLPKSYDGLEDNQHWIKPDQNNTTYRGFGNYSYAGVQGPGILVKGRLSNDDSITRINVRNNGVMYAYTDPAPTAGMKIDVTLVGYNGDLPFTLTRTSGAYYVAGGHAALYALWATEDWYHMTISDPYT